MSFLKLAHNRVSQANLTPAFPQLVTTLRETLSRPSGQAVKGDSTHVSPLGSVHWDVIQEIPAEGLAHANGMFGF